MKQQTQEVTSVAGTGRHPARVKSSGGVRAIAVPPAARALSTLPRIDYADAFLVETGPRTRTPVQWARAMVEDAPIAMRHALRPAWFALGLKLGSARSDRTVRGWETRRSTEDFTLFGADSRYGMPAELLFKREDHTLLFATFVQHENAFARALWAAIAPGHRLVVRYLLEQARRRDLR
jgi:hypothetical protein